MTPTDICNTSEIFVTPKNWLIDLYEPPYPDRDETLPWPPEPADRICIQYCLSVPVEEHCELQVSLAIIIVVIICNLIKVICMSIIALSQDTEPLVTLDDAIASFLDRPDLTTQGNCIAEKARFEDGRSWNLLPSR